MSRTRAWNLIVASAVLALAGLATIRCPTANAGVAGTATTLDMVFVVDESGSMAGDHAWLSDQIGRFDTGLNAMGVTNNRYGLVGFGSATVAPRSILVGGTPYGTAGDVPAQLGITPFLLNGQGDVEDGYAAINFALQNYDFRPEAAGVIVLVTDEGRKLISDPTLTFNSIQSAIQAANVNLMSVLDQPIWTATDVANQKTFPSGLTINENLETAAPDGAGGVVREAGGTLGQAGVPPQTEYSDLTLALGGCVGDLFQVNGALSFDPTGILGSFPIAFLDCLSLVPTGGVQPPPAGDLADIAATDLQRNVAGVLDDNPGAQGELGTANAGIRALGDPALQQAALEALSGREVLATVLIGHNIIEGLLSNIGRYMEGRRTATSSAMFLASLSPSEAATNAEMTRAALEGAYEQPRMTLTPYASGAPQMAGNEDQRWGSFATGRLIWADHDETDDTADGDSFTVGGTVGTDYRMTDNMILGLAIGFSDTDMDFDNADLDAEANTFALYGSYAPDENWYIDTVVHFAYIDYDMTRDIVVPGIDVQADGETDARQFGAQVRTGYDFIVDDQFVVGPVGTVQYIYTDVDGFTESGAGNLSLAYDDNKSDTWLGKIGGQGSYFYDCDWGMLIAQLRASWVYVFEEGDNFEAAFTGALASPFAIPIGDGYDSNYFEVGGGVATRINDDIVLFADYDVTLGHDYITAHFVTFGARLWW